MTQVPIRCAVAAAAFAVVVTGWCPAVATAQERTADVGVDALAETAQDVIDAMRAGDASTAFILLGSDELAARPELLHVILDRAHRLDGSITASDALGRKALVMRLAELATDAQAAAPENDRAAWALALSLVLSERIEATGPERWERAATLLEGVNERTPGGGEALSYAVTFLLEGARRETSSRRALQSRADSLTAAAMTAHPHAGELARTLAASHAWAAKSLVESDRKSSKQATRMALDTLTPPLFKGDLTEASATVYNSAVTLGRDARFGLDKTYATMPAQALEGAVEFQVPYSSSWNVTTVEATEDTAGYTYVTQSDAAGNRVRQLLFRRYYWTSTYTFGDDEVNGDNPKRLAQAMQQMAAERTFAEGAKLSRVTKHKLTDDMTGQRFEIEGTSREEEPEPLRIHGFAARGSRQATIVALVYVYGDADGVGAEMEYVLESLREPEQ